MNGNLLMNCLWYEEILPEQLAELLELTPEMLYDKIFGVSEFTIDEIRKIVAFLDLTEEEIKVIFFEGATRMATKEELFQAVRLIKEHCEKVRSCVSDVYKCPIWNWCRTNTKFDPENWTVPKEGGGKDG